MGSSAVQAKQAANWPIWSCPAKPDPRGKFIESHWWTTCLGAAEERCLIIAGRATLEIDGEDNVVIEAGDWVVFKAGFLCTWHVEVEISKHYEYFDASGVLWTGSTEGRGLKRQLTDDCS